ncbi:hypothetical protein G7046_g9354 [Stylonectria norvegica]|nr:hypothetical protein G7046_g9354 [Stylonectria norvegica]
MSSAPPTACVLCGCPVNLAEKHTTRQTTWQEEFIAVYTVREQWASARLSAPGKKTDADDRYSSDFETEPCNRSDFLKCVFPVYQVSKLLQKGISSGVSRGNVGRNDPFAALPQEMLVAIFIELSSTDVANLKKASRVFAGLVLPEGFWKSRFQVGHEFAHLLPLTLGLDMNGRWETLYLIGRTMFRDPRMVSRKRIWKVATRLSKLIALRLECPTCGGFPIRTLFEPDAPVDEETWITAEGHLSRPEDLYNAGARLLWERVISIPAVINAGEISVSYVCINNKRYISGLRYTDLEGGVTNLGYMHPSQTHCVSWENSWGGQMPWSSSINGFLLAQDSRGIRGLSVLSSCGANSIWIGDFSNLPKRMLALPATERGVNIKGGFDALKLVSLSMLQTAGNKNLHNDISETAELRGGSKWYPDIPASTLSLQRSDAKHLSGGSTYTLALFGGSNGQHLPYLDKILAWSREPDYPYEEPYGDVGGIEFHYSQPVDGTKIMVLGRHRPADATYFGETEEMVLDSENGERIVQFETFFVDSTEIIGLRVNTNRGQVFEFPSRLDGDTEEEDICASSPMKADQGTIVGLFAELAAASRPQLLRFHEPLLRTTNQQDQGPGLSNPGIAFIGNPV